jgi:outer membrane lipoprotein-sorting protein
MKILLILLTINFEVANPQEKDPDQILDEVKKTFNQVEDYVVDVNIKVDVDFIKVPETQATIYYKQPDKVYLESKSFAMLPREGLDFSPIGLLKEKYTAIYEKEDTVSGNKTDVVKVIPLGDESNVVLTTLWIDEAKHFIRKVQSTLKIGGTFSIELKYDNPRMNYPLPSSMIFTFNIERLNLPKGMAGELNKNKSNDEKKTTGKVYITYSNYKVNKSIPDSVFEEKKK